MSMRIFAYALMCLFLFVSLASAQEHVALVSPTGDTVSYAKQKTRTIRVHDTVVVNRILVVHDTVRELRTIAIHEIEKPYTLNIAIAQRRDTLAIDKSSESHIGVFGLSTFRSNMLGPAYAFSLGPFRVFLIAGISYLSDYEKRQVIANAGIAGFASF